MLVEVRLLRTSTAFLVGLIVVVDLVGFVEVVEVIVVLEVVSVKELVAVVEVGLLVVNVVLLEAVVIVIFGVVVASNDVSKKDFYQCLTQTADRAETSRIFLIQIIKFRFSGIDFSVTFHFCIDPQVIHGELFRNIFV